MNGRRSKQACGPSAATLPAERRHAVPDWTEGMPVFIPQAYEAG
jgi:hypothetical protein